MKMFGLSVGLKPSVIAPIIRRCYCQGFSERERLTGLDDEEKAALAKQRKLEKWQLRKPTFQSSPIFNVAPDKWGLFSNTLSSDPNDWVNWYKKKKIMYLRDYNKFRTDRVQILGSDLGLAHFLVHRECRVRKRGTTNFLTSADEFDLPSSYERHWEVEEVDASGSQLTYEALENFKNVMQLKIVSFRNCPYFDDWCLERLLCLCPSIEVLDISENVKITERGLEGLYRFQNLKKLIVTDWRHGPAFELTCMMLEDCLPDLTVIIEEPCVSVNEDFDTVSETKLHC